MNLREAYQVLLNGGRIWHASWQSKEYVQMDADGRTLDEKCQVICLTQTDHYQDVSLPKSRTYYTTTDALSRAVIKGEVLECFCGIYNKKIKIEITEVVS